MDLYHAWFDLADGVSDVEFAEHLARYMGHLSERDLISSWRLTRKKLGLAPGFLKDFHLVIETADMAALDRAFNLVASRAGQVEDFHAAVNQRVKGAFFALYRDFPDPVRQRGEERF